MRIIVGIVAGLVLGGLVHAAEQMYTLREVNSVEDVAKCITDRGLAGRIAPIDSEGYVGDWVDYCVIPVK